MFSLLKPALLYDPLAPLRGNSDRYGGIVRVVGGRGGGLGSE